MTAPAAASALRTRPDRSTVAGAAGALVVAGYVTLLMWSADRVSYDTWFPMVAIPVLAGVGVMVLHRATAKLGDRWLFQIAVLALLLKLTSGVLRWVMAYVIYNGSDAGHYHDFGAAAYEEYRFLDFSRELPHGGIPGTGFVAAVTAVLYTVTSPTMTGGFVVFAFMGFWGQWLAYLAFRRAVPEGHHRRYALLVFLLPTLVFWPSALGKDAWMQLSIGTFLLGASCLAARRRRLWGLLLVVTGVAAAGGVRPHIAGFLVVALAAGLVLQRPARRTAVTPLLQVAVACLLVGGALLAVGRAADFVGAESLAVEDLQTAAQAAGGRTEQGGSEFTPVPLFSPLGPAAALFTVVFRPLPFDAHNLQSMLAAAESTLLLWLTWCWRLSLWSAVLNLRQWAYPAACVVGTLLFVAAFAEFANFGILARQRAQFLPMFLVLLCLPVSRPRPFGVGCGPPSRDRVLRRIR